jgi:secondary thiamine-phosphate synthase enzyme
MRKTIQLNTGSRSEMLDMSAEIQAVVSSSGVREGFCYVFNPHTTAGLTVNEHADPAVVYDIIRTLDQTIPWQNAYRHAEGNAAAHIKASLFGSSLMLMVEKGRLVLGTWQGIFFCEFDGPRQREVYVKVVESV